MGQKTNASIFRLGLKGSEWNNKYIEKTNEECSLTLYKNNEIQFYIGKVFNTYNMLIHSCKIEHTENCTNILISYCRSTGLLFNKNEPSFNNERQTVLFLLKNVVAVVLNIYLQNKTINVKTQNLLKKFEVQLQKKPLWVSEYKKATKHLKRFSRTTEQKDFVKLLFISVFEKGSAQLLAKVISLYITKNKKKHYYLFFLLKYILNVLIKLNFSKVQGIKIIVKGRLNGVPRAKQKNIQIGTLQLQSFNQNVSYYNETSYTPNGTFGIKVWICEKK